MMIRRDIIEEIKKHLLKKEITVLLGARQVGKTTILKKLQEDLERKGEKTVFLNLDIEEDFTQVESQKKLLNQIKLEVGSKKAFVFIDEVQRKENAGLFLKGLYDMELPYKFIVSGSGSVELKSTVQESLAGRKKNFYINPISFKEFLNYSTEYKYEGKLLSYSQNHKESVDLLLKEYVMYGGYPRIVISETMQEKRDAIREIFQSYLVKDISYILEVDNPEIIANLVEYIAIQNGGIINYNDACSALDISYKLLKRYIYYLEKTFIIKRVRPFYSNKQKEIVKAPVIYFNDLGMRNYASQEFGNVPTADELGLLFENAVFQELNRRYMYRLESIKYWRTKTGKEVDFVIATMKKQIPIEVKYRGFDSRHKGLMSFIEEYKPENAYLLNLDYNTVEKIGSTSLEYIDYMKFFLGDKV